MIEFDGSEASLLLAGIFEWLDKENIKYCVERNYQGYPTRLTGDLDLVVSDHQVEKAAEGITTLAKRMGWVCYQDHIWVKSAYLGLAKSIFPKRFAFTVELFAGARWRGLPYLPASEVLEQRLKYGITWRPRPSHQAVITSVHHLLYNDHVPEKYRREIHSLVQEDSKSFLSILSCSFGRKLAGKILNNVAAEDWDALAKHVQNMKYSLLQRKLLMNPITTVLTTYKGYKAKHQLPEGVVLLVNSKEADQRNDFCSSLLELADRWHLFVPPVRKVLGNGEMKIKQTMVDAVCRIMHSGGVAILSCKRSFDISLPLNFPIYKISVLDKQWEISLEMPNLANDSVIYNGTIKNIETASAQIWNSILADRALRRSR